jgi:hypothetical protein
MSSFSTADYADYYFSSDDVTVSDNNSVLLHSPATTLLRTQTQTQTTASTASITATASTANANANANANAITANNNATAVVVAVAVAVAVLDFNDDIEKDNPDTVDKILLKELYNLSMKDRIDYQEEMHGVKCLAPEENSELLINSITKFNNILLSLQQQDDNNNNNNNNNNQSLIIPIHEKIAYLQAIQLQQQQQNSNNNNSNNSNSNSNNLNSNNSNSNNNNSYIDSNEFKLRFIRSELFDIDKAVLRYIKWCNLVIELFGIYALQRPIQISDFTREELKYFKKGRYVRINTKIYKQ